FNAYSTANFSGTSLNDAGTGFSYASFLMGAVGGSTSNDSSSTSLGLDYVSELAGRYKVISPYIRDSYKVTSKLTLDLGLRWDYLPPFHELRNRWTFLNPTLMNPNTGTAGMLQFAGNYGGAGVSCQCTTPVSTYLGNLGPRVGLAYSLNNKTVVRAGYAQVFSQAGGVGGRGGAYNGTGQTGFNVSAIGPTESGNGATAGPSYWLNNSTYFGTVGLSNSGLFGPGFTYPSAPTPGAAAQELNTGFYVNSATGKVVSASSVSYADPHYSGRAPELELYNFGLERAITPSMTLALNYVGNESHFIVNSGTTGANARGYWSNEVSPTYLSILGPVLDSTGSKPLLNAQATPANLSILAQYAPSAPQPAFFAAAGAISSSATIQQMLTHFPQYSGVSDAWGNVGNFSYNSLQIVLQQRMSHGLNFTVNYTWAKNIGDDGTYRTGFPLPSVDISRSTGASYKQDRIDRSWTAISLPQVVHAFAVYQLPFGKGQIGGNSMLVRGLAGGWQFSANYTYQSGYPMSVTWAGASGTNTPGQGQGMPDINPNSMSAARHNARINGSYGSGPNGTNACNLGIGAGCKAVPYVDVGAFTSPISVSTAPNCTPGTSNQPSNCNAAYLIGNAPRTKPLNLNYPGTEDIDASVRRTFPLHFEGTEFVFEADCLNVWNKNTFGNPGASWANASTTFGTITSASGARDWQFAGHINF
ncbi:MAG: TonB-dependent receptor, partial [Terracidiphilus sp.]